MKSFVFHLKKLDWILIISSLFLVGFGLLSIYSSSLFRGDFLNFKKQLIFFVLGFFLMILFSFFDWRVFQADSKIILFFYFLFLFLLIFLFFFAPEIRGVKSWYVFGPLSFDPTEFLKIVIILLLAKYFSKKHIELYRVSQIFISGFYVFLPSLFIFLQPNLGAVFILFLIWLGILLISGLKVRHFLLLLVLLILFLIFSWSFLLKEYQKERILSFLFPHYQPLAVGWQQKQAKIAIGSGSFFGQGLGQGSQTQKGFLPEPQTDFIFSVIAEEMGFFGVSFLFFFFSLLIWRIYKIALSAPSNFSRLFSLGMAILISFQFFVNIGVNLGLFPVVGISLPLVSYGGSSLIATFLGLGIVESIKSH